MAKGLRSKSKRHFRTLKRGVVAESDARVEAEQRKQEELQAVLAAPKPAPPPADAAGAVPVGMEGVEGGAAPLGEGLTTTNPGKLLKKLRRQRREATKGIHKATSKKAKPLAGANQFHKTKKKKRN